MNYTSIPQSKKLLELGMNSETADMSYVPHKEEDYEIMWLPSLCFYPEMTTILKGGIELKAIPCWSTDGLLKSMPKLAAVEYDLVQRLGECYVAFDDLLNGIHEDFLGSNPFEAAYNMVVWLLENNYFNNTKGHEED